MAFTRTTLASAIADANDQTITVASATGFAADQIIRVDNEWMVVQKTYASGVIIPVRRGQQGSKAVAHAASAGVITTATASDWAAPGSPAMVPSVGPRVVDLISVSATGTLSGLIPGHDTRVILNGTTIITLTIPVPTVDQDGDRLTILSNGVAAHVPTFTGGLGGVGAGYTALTGAAAARGVNIDVYAVNGAWNVISAPAWTGTVTKVTAGIA